MAVEQFDFSSAIVGAPKPGTSVKKKSQPQVGNSTTLGSRSTSQPLSSSLVSNATKRVGSAASNAPSSDKIITSPMGIVGVEWSKKANEPSVVPAYDKTQSKQDINVLAKNVLDRSKYVATDVKKFNNDAKLLEQDVAQFNSLVKTNPNNPDLLALQQQLQQREVDIKKRATSLQTSAKELDDAQMEIKRKAVENYNQKAQQGNWGGFTWNKIVEGLGQISGGLEEQVAVWKTLGAQTLDLLGIKTGELEKKPWLLSGGGDAYRMEKLKELQAMHNPSIEEMKTKGTTPEYMQELEKGSAWAKALGGVASSVPAMAGGLPFMALQSLGSFYKQIDSDPAFKNIPRSELDLIAMPLALGTAWLEEAGVRTLLGKGAGPVASLLTKVFNKIPKNAPMELIKKTFQDLAETEAGKFAGKVAKSKYGKIANRFIAGAKGEAETEVEQGVLEDELKRLYNYSKDNEAFKIADFASKEYNQKRGEEAKLGAMGSLILGGPIMAVQSISQGKTVSDDDYISMRDLITDPEQLKLMRAKIAVDLVSEKITKEEADKKLKDIDSAHKILKTIPDNLSVESQRKAYAILSKNTTLQKEIDDTAKSIEGKDPNLVTSSVEYMNKKQAEIEKNNQELSKLPQNAVQEQTTSEVPIQPEAGASVQMAEGEPQAEPQVPTQEGQGQEVDNRPIAERQAEAESKIKRKDLFDGVGEFSTELGGSDMAAVPVSHNEIGGIEFVEYAHPETGSVDVIVTGKSGNDFVGFYRIYENGKPTNKWSSKFENQSRNKEDFKTMISGIQSMLPKGHEYTEKTSISTDGLRVWNQQLSKGYELQYDNNGKLITSPVFINGDSIENDLGVPVDKGNFDNVRVRTEEEFNKAKAAVLPYLKKFNLGEENIRWVNGSLKIDLPVLKKSEGDGKIQPEVATSLQVEPKTPTQEVKAEEVVAETPKQTEAQQKENAIMSPILNGFNEVMDSVDKLIARQKKRGIVETKIVSNIDTLIRKSEVYKNATDAQKKILEREGRAKIGARERRAPSVGRVLGVLKDFTNISREEKFQIIKQIRNLSRDAASNLAKEIRQMAKTGKITVKQAADVIARFGKVNMLNEISVGNFVDYMSRVFNDAEYAQKIDLVKKKLSTAKKNIAKKIGMADGLIIPLQKLFALNPNIIPIDLFDQYVGIVDMFGSKDAVLSLDEKSQVTQKVQDILDALNIEQSQIIDLADKFNNYENVVYNEDGNIDYPATLKAMLEDEIIDDKQAEIMRKYKSDIIPSTQTTPKTEQEIQQEKDILKDVLSKTQVSSQSLSNRYERDLANQLIALKSSGAINELSVSELNNLIKVLGNINNGYLPHYAELMVERLDAINNEKILSKALKVAKPLKFTSVYTKVKSWLTGKGSILEMIRRNPLANIDQLFGNFKSKEIFNSLLNKSAEAASAFQFELKKVQDILQDAELKVAQSFKLDPNKTTMSKFKMMTYLIQLEFDSNKNNKQVNKASDFIKSTIKHIESGKSRFDELDATMLKEILDNYSDKEGDIDINKLYESFNNAEKSAIKDIKSINESLSERAAFTASVIRGDKFNPLTNYVHLNVLNEDKNKDTDISLSDDYNNSLKPSTKAKSLIERTGKVSPLNFDVFASAERGAKFVLLDYNLTRPIRTARKTLNLLDKANENDRDMINAVNDIFDESVENLLSNSIVNNSLVDNVVNYINKQGYRMILAGAGRFIGELSSNIGFAAISDPKALATSFKNKEFIVSSNAPLVMKNVNSKQTSRIFPSNTLSGRFVDTSILNQANGITKGKAKNAIANKIQQIWNLSGKKYKNSVELIADTLISTPDKLIMRPLWFGSFANTFKDITGEDVDFDKIASNDEQYMNANKKAIEEAKKIADERSVMTGATDNPFMGIMKGTNKPNQSFTTRAFNNFNNFMTRFLIFEYVTARTAINAAMGNGSMTKQQGVALLSAVTTRMIVYSMVMQALYSGGEDDEETILQKFGQALASTLTSLLLNRDFGNATKSIINAGIEKLNEKYLQFLRGGEYDPYKDSLQYSILPQEKSGKQNDIGDLILNMGGAFGPSLKTANFLYKKATEDKKKQIGAIKRQRKENEIRVPLEILGTAGFIPFYKDVRKMAMNYIYADLNKEQKRKSK